MSRVVKIVSIFPTKSYTHFALGYCVSVEALDIEVTLLFEVSSAFPVITFSSVPFPIKGARVILPKRQDLHVPNDS